MSSPDQPGKERVLNALVGVLSEKGASQLTVQELLRRSGVNRSTFYYHFKNLDEAISSLMEGFVESFRAGFALLLERGAVDGDTAAGVIRSSVSYVWENQDAFCALVFSEMGAEFEERLRQVIYEECRRYETPAAWPGEEPLFASQRELDMYLSAFSAFIVAMLVFEASNGFEETPEEFSWLWMRFARIMGGGEPWQLKLKG